MKSAEFSCGRLGFGMEKYIKQKKKEKNTENIKKEVCVGEGMCGHGPQTVLSGTRESADDCLAMKCGVRNGTDGRLAKKKSPKRRKKNKIQKQKRNKKEYASLCTSAAYVHHTVPVRSNIGSQRLRANARKEKRLLVPIGMYTSIAPRPSYARFLRIFSPLFILGCPWISCLSFILFPFSDGDLGDLGNAHVRFGVWPASGVASIL